MSLTAMNFSEWFQYIKFIYSSFHLHLSPGIRNQFDEQLPVGLLAQCDRALHRCCKGQRSNPGKPEFFQALFSQLH